MMLHLSVCTLCVEYVSNAISRCIRAEVVPMRKPLYYSVSYVAMLCTISYLGDIIEGWTESDRCIRDKGIKLVKTIKETCSWTLQKLHFLGDNSDFMSLFHTQSKVSE